MIVFFLDGAINLVAGMWQETPCDYDSMMHNAMRRLAVDYSKDCNLRHWLYN